MKRLALFLLLLAPSLALAVGPATEQVSCATGAVSEIGTASGRVSLAVVNQDTTNNVCVGFDPALTCSGGDGTDGVVLRPGAGIDYNAFADGFPEAGFPVYCRGSGGTVVVGFSEFIR